MSISNFAGEKCSHRPVAGHGARRSLVDGSQSRGYRAWRDYFAFNLQAKLAQKSYIDIHRRIFGG
jgi:hypothetical protein